MHLIRRTAATLLGAGHQRYHKLGYEAPRRHLESGLNPGTAVRDEASASPGSMKMPTCRACGINDLRAFSREYTQSRILDGTDRASGLWLKRIAAICAWRPGRRRRGGV